MTTPPGACDCHVYIYDPDQGPTPDGAGRIFPAATLAAYRRVQVRPGRRHAVIVQRNAHGTDNRITLAVVAALGPDARDVAIVTPAMPDSELARLHAAGIRSALPHAQHAIDVLGRRRGAGGANRAAGRACLGAMRRPLFAASGPGAATAALSGGDRPHLQASGAGPARSSGCQVLPRLLDTGQHWLKLAVPCEVPRTGGPAYADVGAIAMAAVRAAPEHVISITN